MTSAATTTREREKLRQSFRPARVQLLFIGESPPVSGRFFYCANTGLYRAIRSAFQLADPRITDHNFLAAFRAYGCYLTDVSHEPVNHLAPPLRRATVAAGEKTLAHEIASLRPVVIAPMLLSIAKNVNSAIARAKWQGELLQFPYPGRWIRHREEFIKTLLPVLKRLKKIAVTPFPSS
jgi:hypothetical protein